MKRISDQNHNLRIYLRCYSLMARINIGSIGFNKIEITTGGNTAAQA